MRIGVDRRVLSIAVAFGLAGCVTGGLASIAQADGSCANEQLRTEQPYGLELPDCRAYEMVSPLDKDDNNVIENSARAAASGEAITYESKGAFAEPAGGMASDRYVARRGFSDWENRNITPRYHAFTGNLATPFSELLFTPDLSKGILRSEDTPLTSGTPAGYVNLYVADTSNGSYQAVTAEVQSKAAEEPYESLPVEPQLAGASTDLSHIVFQELGFEGLTSDASSKQTHLYESAAGHLSLVDLPPEGKTLEAENDIGAPGGFGEPATGDPWHAVSADGLRVFFTGGEAEGPEGARERLGQVYVREVSQARTIEVSASQRKIADPHGLGPARYWDASTDGSRVFFTSRTELTDDANTGSADNAANLYEYDLESGVLSDLSVDTSPGDVNGASVLGLVTASDDGSYIYFVAEGALAGPAVSGEPNLYLNHSGKLSFIATLASATSRGETRIEGGGDSKDWYGAEPNPGDIPYGSWGPGSHSVRVSHDGTRLAFESEQSLTGYDNEIAEPSDLCETGKCREVYQYNAQEEVLSCVSCDPSGARPTGPATLGGSEEAKTVEAFGTNGLDLFYEPRNFSENGSRLFFQSPDPLVQHDSNGRQDVYEYEDGQTYPISDVAGNNDSSFLDASTSGNDVFIATADHLLPSDTDSRVDAYDVRIGGGLPVSITPPACVNGDSCKGPAALQPGVFGAPASATFSGAGNVSPVAVLKRSPKVKAKPKRCRRGLVKKLGRCVERKVKGPSGHSNKGRK